MRQGPGGAAPWWGRVAAAERELRAWEGTPMNLVVWLPAMFLLGLVSMGLCIAFVKACEVI